MSLDTNAVLRATMRGDRDSLVPSGVDFIWQRRLGRNASTCRLRHKFDNRSIPMQAAVVFADAPSTFRTVLPGTCAFRKLKFQGCVANGLLLSRLGTITESEPKLRIPYSMQHDDRYNVRYPSRHHSQVLFITKGSEQASRLRVSLLREESKVEGPWPMPILPLVAQCF